MHQLLENRNELRYLLSRIILLTIGATLAALSVSIFFLPSSIAPSGITGVGVILNELVGVPVGLVILVGNLPIQALAFKMLKGWRTVAETVYAIILFAVLVELLPRLLPIPASGLTDEGLLNAVFGGVIGGIGGGLVYRAGGTMGGTSTLARIVRYKLGVPLRSASLYTDTLVILAAGVFLGWERALLATVAVFVNRMASDYILEDSTSTNTAFIVTEQPDVVSQALENQLRHQITRWPGQPNGSGREYGVLMATISQLEMNALRKLLRAVDPEAFVTAMRAQITYGEEFKSMAPQLPLNLDEVDEDVDIDMKWINELREEHQNGHEKTKEHA